MKTESELSALYDSIRATMKTVRTLTDANETYRGDGIGFGSISSTAPSQNDYIDGAGGNDYISGFGANDIVIGGAGNDTVSGGPGAAPNFTDDGGDWVFGDRVDVSGNSDALSDGADVLGGNKGNDFLFGNGGNDRILGGNFANSLQSGNDYMSGGAGDDLLIGGDGDDEIVGGTSLPFTLTRVSPGNPPVSPAAPLEADIAAFLQTSGDGFRYRWDVGGQSLYYEVLAGNSTTSVLERDELYGVEFGYTSADNTQLLGLAAGSWSEALALTQWTIEITRYTNGAGELKLLMNGQAVEGANFSSTAFAGGGPLALAKDVGAGRFVFDDATPLLTNADGIDDGRITYDAIYRADARQGKADGPGAIELLGTTGRVAIQIHTLGNNAGNTSASEGCYAIPLAAIQRIENLILACAPNADGADLTTSSNSRGSAAGFTSGAGHTYWDLFWHDTSVAESQWKSQIAVVIKDAEKIEQPTLHFGAATRSGDQLFIPITIDDGGDNAISKALRIDIKLGGLDGVTIHDDADARTNGRQVLIERGETQGVLVLDLPANTGKASVRVEMSAVTPLNGDHAYAEYTSDRSRLRDLFFDDPDTDRLARIKFSARSVISQSGTEGSSGDLHHQLHDSFATGAFNESGLHNFLDGSLVHLV